MATKPCLQDEINNSRLIIKKYRANLKSVGNPSVINRIKSNILKEQNNVKRLMNEKIRFEKAVKSKL